MTLRHPVNIRHHEEATLGERMADRVAAGLGSWRFLGLQTAVIVCWIAYNGYVAVRWLHGQGFDAFPFILLNLVFSTQAAYAAPILQLSGNRQSQKDRLTLEQTYADTERLLAEIDRNTTATLAIAKHLEVELEP